MFDRIKKLFKKKAKNKIATRIRFLDPTWTTLEKPPPDGICYVGVNKPIIITKHSTLVKNGEDKTYIYFRVFNPFLAVSKEAPDLAIVRISRYRLNNLKKQYRKL